MLVHRRVGGAHQAVGVDPVRDRRDADAGTQGHEAPVEPHLGVERVPQTVGRRFGVGAAGAVEQHAELVAAEPGRDVARSQGAPQALGDDPQQLVTRGVAEEVVDALEAVEVDEEQRARARGLDPLAEQPPVGRPGQRVVLGLVADLRAAALELLEAGGVLERDAGVGGEQLEGLDLLVAQLAVALAAPTSTPASSPPTQIGLPTGR